MAKELSAIVKLQIKGGAANPSPPIGPALGAKGVNIMEFCKQFNARTQDQPGKATARGHHPLGPPQKIVYFRRVDFGLDNFR